MSHKPTLEQWLVQALRVTVFFNAEAKVPDDLFTLVVGRPPEQESRQRQTGQVIESGSVDLGNFELRRGIDRIDLVLSAFGADADIPVVGALPNISNMFQSYGEKLIRGLDGVDVIRIAYGAVCVATYPSEELANAALVEHAGLRGQGLEQSKDLFVQVNFPVDSKVFPDLKLNRLIKRSIGKFQLFEFKVSQGQAMRMREQLVYQLETDINTSASNTAVFSNDAAGKLLSELMKIGSDVAV